MIRILLNMFRTNHIYMGYHEVLKIHTNTEVDRSIRKITTHLLSRKIIQLLREGKRWPYTQLWVMLENTCHLESFFLKIHHHKDQWALWVKGQVVLINNLRLILQRWQLNKEESWRQANLSIKRAFPLIMIHTPSFWMNKISISRVENHSLTTILGLVYRNW